MSRKLSGTWMRCFVDACVVIFDDDAVVNGRWWSGRCSVVAGGVADGDDDGDELTGVGCVKLTTGNCEREKWNKLFGQWTHSNIMCDSENNARYLMSFM